jgi:hypothetical protein
MKKTILTVLMLMCCVPVGHAAPGTGNVANTIHNFSVTAPDDPFLPGFSYFRTNEDEVCIFCHTPHGGSLTGPLWNRSNPTSTWTHYNSATLSTQLLALPVTRPVGNESLICLSCHDGTVSVNHIVNPSNDIGLPLNDLSGSPDGIFPAMFSNVGNFGGDLSDDHPMSFSYTDVWGSWDYQGGSRAGMLHDVDTAKGKGVRFFGAANLVECSSCHDPHVDYSSLSGQADYSPFLITPNTGSLLCLACHNK